MGVDFDLTACIITVYQHHYMNAQDIYIDVNLANNMLISYNMLMIWRLSCVITFCECMHFGNIMEDSGLKEILQLGMLLKRVYQIVDNNITINLERCLFRG